MKLIFIIVFFLLVIKLNSQELTSMSFQSPNASSLGKYGSYPVSLYTGLPNISVPIWQINYKDINLPIDISYHASGIRVQDEASWVGLGWVLNCGGVITRSVNDKDDLGFERSIKNGTYLGFPYDVTVPSSDESFEYRTKLLNGETDAAPDDFYFNFAGYQGKFFLKQGQNISDNFIIGTLSNDNNIQVVYDKTSSKWILTAPNGFKYYFGTIERTEVQTGTSENVWLLNEGFQSNDYGINITSWYLDKIESPVGSVINFEYCLNLNGTADYESQSVHFKTDKVSKLMAVLEYTPNSTSCWQLEPHVCTSTTNFSENIYLKRVYWANGEITFIKSNREDIQKPKGSGLCPWILHDFHYGPQKLDQIDIKDITGKSIKSYAFEYSYFNNSTSADVAHLYKRLKLEKLKELSASGTEIGQNYQFTYDESVSLPSKESLGQDFWGFYNGKDDNKSFVPSGRYFLDIAAQADIPKQMFLLGDGDRFPDPTKNQAGILKQIKYPTGGFTNFTYEPNDYYESGDGAWDITDEVKSDPISYRAIVNDWLPGPDETIPNEQTISFTLTEPSMVTYDISISYREKCRNSESADPFSEVGDGIPLVNEICMNYPGNNGVEHKIFGAYYYANNGSVCTYTEHPSVYLPAGTYSIYVKSYKNWEIACIANQIPFKDRTLKKNSKGIYAKIGSGLRISEMRENSGTGIENVTKYLYTTKDVDLNNDLRSTGRLMMLPVCHQVKELVQHPLSADCLFHTLVLEGNSFSLVQNNTSGNILGYDEVTVLHGDDNGFEINGFTNISECLRDGYFIPGMPNISNAGNGTLIYKWIYDKNVNLVKTLDYNYTLKPLNTALCLKWIQAGHGLSNEFYIIFNNYYLYSTRNELSSVTEESFFGSKSVKINTSYEYNTKGMPVKTTKDISDNNQKIEIYSIYPTDFTSISGFIKDMTDANIISEPVEQYTVMNGKVTEGTLNTYKTGAQAGLLDKTYKLETTTPLTPNSTFYPSAYGNSFSIGSWYKPKISFDSYSSGNLLQYHKENDITTSNIWGYNDALPIAVVKNANSSNIALANFESTIDKGNWTTNTYGSGSARTGNVGGVSISLTKTGLTQGNYKLSFWAIATNGTGTVSGSVSQSVTSTTWKYYEFTLSNVTSVSLSTNSNMSIDDVRLYPAGAQMTTYTHHPLVGVTSITDANNKTTFYEYDSFGRLSTVKDYKGNILNQYRYNYKK